MPAEYTNDMIINSNEEYTVTFTTAASALVGGITINNMPFAVSNVILPTNINDYVEGEMTIDNSGSFTALNAGPLL